MREEELLFDKEYTCPVCERKFTAKVVRSSRVMSGGMDIDMRPKTKNIEVMKYRVQECPLCGYASLERSFNDVRKREAVYLREKCLSWDTEAEMEDSARSYEDAYHHYRAAIRCNLVRGAKSSIRGYTALCAAWLLRSWRESLEKEGKTIADDSPMSSEEERRLIKYAVNNFKDAEVHENFPLNRMEEPTFNYLMAVLTYKQQNRADAQRYVIRALQSSTLKPTVRRMAEDLRDMIKHKEHLE